MVSKTSVSHMTTLEQRVLRDYQRSKMQRYKVAEKNAHVTIRASLLNWLAQPVMRESYKIEDLPFHDQVDLVEKLVKHLQTKRNKKAKETRTDKKALAQLELNQVRQGSFEL